MTTRAFATAAALATVLAGCGYKGPLTLPESTGPVITRPAAGTATPQAPAPQDPKPKPVTQPTPTPPSPAPASPPVPAPEGTPTGG